MSEGIAVDKESILHERSFLHDLSNQLVIAQGMGGFVLNSIEKAVDEDSKELQRMRKTVNAIDKMIQMVRDRRDAVRSREREIV
ncbi:MAG: hypothetical protein KAG61_00405 [Bacteriovoracaceae bacterium]|nr:hypothetical protein [Bacteriovoracaceae bacterium]